MKWTFATFFMIILGLFGLVIIFLFQDITISNEDDYYNLKEITEASMLDSLDIAYYRSSGEIKIIKEKFVEVFTKRFVNSTTFSSKGYTIDFYGIMEEPPKVTVKITNTTSSYTLDTDDFNIVNELSAILESYDAKS